MNIFEKVIYYNILPKTQKNEIYNEIEKIVDSLNLKMRYNDFERDFIASTDETNLITASKEWDHFARGHRRGISYRITICNDGTIKSCAEKFASNDRFAKAVYVMFRSKWREQINKNK